MKLALLVPNTPLVRREDLLEVIRDLTYTLNSPQNKVYIFKRVYMGLLNTTLSQELESYNLDEIEKFTIEDVTLDNLENLLEDYKLIVVYEALSEEGLKLGAKAKLLGKSVVALSMSGKVDRKIEKLHEGALFYDGFWARESSELVNFSNFYGKKKFFNAAKNSLKMVEGEILVDDKVENFSQEDSSSVGEFLEWLVSL